MGEIRLETIKETEANTFVMLHPQWNYQESAQVSRSLHRTLNGKLFSYKWGNFARISLPLQFVPPDVGAVLEQWWRDDERLLFRMDTDKTRNGIVCLIGGELSPLPYQEAGNPAYRKGNLLLESVDGRTRLGRPFILGHITEGVLGNPELSLI